MSLLAALVLLAAQPAEHETYRAIGTAPLWQVTVANGYMGFDTQARGTVSVGLPERQETELGFAWRTDRLAIIVEHGDCTDPLTRRVYADRVRVESDGRHYEGCGGARRGPALPQSYDAAGSEPFWSLEIADGRLYFGVNDEVVIVPTPRPVVTGNGRVRRYRAPGITVVLRRENCELEDERVYADDVTIIAGHWRVDGCGGRVVREAPGE